MEEFKNLSWSQQNACDDIEKSYDLDMDDYATKNIKDVFFSCLYEADPAHYRLNSSKESTKTSQQMCKFPDPRTGVENPTHECLYEDVDIALRRVGKTPSLLKPKNHKTGLKAMHLLGRDLAMSFQEQKLFTLYESTAQQRTTENALFLEELREYSTTNLSSRYHNVPASMEQFVMNIWKKRLAHLHRTIGNTKITLRTALTVQSTNCEIQTKMIHCEQLGEVKAICDDQSIQYIRQSSANLQKIYNEQRTAPFLMSVKAKGEELRRQHRITFQLPISIIRLILCGDSDSCFSMSIKEAGTISLFGSNRTVVFEKPLAPLYTSGNKRHRIGAKYVTRFCFTRKANECNTCDENVIDGRFDENSTFPYKVEKFDEFMQMYNAKHPEMNAHNANTFFRVFELTGDVDEDAAETHRVLITSKQDAYKKNVLDKRIFVNFSPKIEFQAEYGAETMSKNELIREWCDLYFRPDSVTERIRYDCVSGKIICRESISLEHVTTVLKTQYNIEHQQLLQCIFHALNTFIGFPAGEYLLRGNRAASNHIKVYEKCTTNADNLTISQLYKGAVFEKNLMDPVNWQPIDHNIITESHEKHDILPGCFPHSEFLRKHKLSNYQIRNPNRPNIRRLQIQPDDDLRKEPRQTKRQLQLKEQTAKVKRHKKTNRRERQKVVRLNAKNEAEELAANKNLMDDFSITAGEMIQNSFAVMEPIASRTRRRSLQASPSKS